MSPARQRQQSPGPVIRGAKCTERSPGSRPAVLPAPVAFAEAAACTVVECPAVLADAEPYPVSAAAAQQERWVAAGCSALDSGAAAPATSIAGVVPAAAALAAEW